MSGGAARARRPIVAGLVVLVALAAGIAASPRILLYDERYYMEASYFLAAHLDFVRLMTTPLDLAAGPLYAYLHVAAAALTDLRPPAIRYVNWAALTLTLALCAAALREMRYTDPLARAAMLLAVPMAMPTGGLALTEVPAMAFAALSVFAVTRALTRRSSARLWFWWTVAGLAAGVAVLGRQTYLPGIAGFVLVGLGDRRHLLPAIVATVSAGLALVPLILLWGGLIPPWQVSAMTTVVPEHGALAFIYLAVTAALIAPSFFLEAVDTPRNRALAAAVLVVAPAIGFIASIRLEVASRVVAAAPASLRAAIATGLAAAMVAVAAAMLFAAAIHAWQRRTDRRFLLLALLTVLLCGTAAGIGHQFSSRYVLSAYPFALLMLQPWVVPGSWAAARLLTGAALGFASLAAYYWNAPPTDQNFRLSAPAEIVAQMPLERLERTTP